MVNITIAKLASNVTVPLQSGILLCESADVVWLEMTGVAIKSLLKYVQPMIRYMIQIAIAHPSSVGNLLSKFTAKKLTIAISPKSNLSIK